MRYDFGFESNIAPLENIDIDLSFVKCWLLSIFLSLLYSIKFRYFILLNFYSVFSYSAVYPVGSAPYIYIYIFIHPFQKIVTVKHMHICPK